MATDADVLCMVSSHFLKWSPRKGGRTRSGVRRHSRGPTQPGYPDRGFAAKRKQRLNVAASTTSGRWRSPGGRCFCLSSPHHPRCRGLAQDRGRSPPLSSCVSPLLTRFGLIDRVARAMGDLKRGLWLCGRTGLDGPSGGELADVVRLETVSSSSGFSVRRFAR